MKTTPSPPWRRLRPSGCCRCKPCLQQHESVIKALQTLEACAQIQIVRLKDRVEVSSFGWRDYLLNAVFKKGVAPDVEFELQISLQAMFAARSGVGLHRVLAKNRLVLELDGWDCPEDPRKPKRRRSTRGHSMQILMDRSCPVHWRIE